MTPTHGVLHATIARHFIDHGTAPTIAQIGAQLELDRATVSAALHALAKYHGVVLHPASGEIWALHPFSAAPTAFWVESRGRGWWGNCAWCSLGIVTLLNTDATILAYTADEAWEHAPFTEGSVHEQDFPEADPAFAGGKATAKVNRLLEIRKVVQTAIEERIQAKEFSKNNEAAVTLVVPEKEAVYDLLRDRQFATEFFIIADLDVSAGPALSAKAEKTKHKMCPRCRRYEPLGKGGVCKRCESVVQTVSRA